MVAQRQDDNDKDDDDWDDNAADDGDDVRQRAAISTEFRLPVSTADRWSIECPASSRTWKER